MANELMVNVLLSVLIVLNQLRLLIEREIMRVLFPPYYMHICIHNNINYNRRKRKRRAQNTACSRPVFFNFRLLLQISRNNKLMWCQLPVLIHISQTMPILWPYFGLNLSLMTDPILQMIQSFTYILNIIFLSSLFTTLWIWFGLVLDL